MSDFVPTNVQMYGEIAEDAFRDMENLLEKGRRSKPGGDGWIIKPDPNHKSFKSALVFIAFSGMWLEATLHLLIVKHHGTAAFNKIDNSKYEAKLKFLGIDDQSLSDCLADFRILRRELLHEKAFLKQFTKPRIAQDEARKVRSTMQHVRARLEKANLLDW